MAAPGRAKFKQIAALERINRLPGWLGGPVGGLVGHEFFLVESGLCGPC